MNIQFVPRHLGPIASVSESRYWWYVKVDWTVH